MATLRSVILAIGLFGWMIGGSASATDCCVLNPNLRLHFSGECTFEGSVQKCDPIEQAVGNKPGLLSFLHDEVGGDPFPSGAFVYVCPIDPSELLPATNVSFVRDKSGFSVDVTPYLKFFVYFDQLIFQGTYDSSNQAEKSKDEFPMVFQINGSNGGTTNIRLIGLGKESYNAKPIAEDDTQQVSANVSGNVVSDPDNANQLKGEAVLVEGKPVCTTKEEFVRD